MIIQNKTGIRMGAVYFIIHLLVEIVCFAALYKFFASPGIPILIAFTYDAFAFVTQGLFGEIMNRFDGIDYGSLGVFLMTAGTLMLWFLKGNMTLLSLIILCLGNALLHECGAIHCVSRSDGALFPSALFVGGGSFGVILGQILGQKDASIVIFIILLAATEVFILLANRIMKTTEPTEEKYSLVKENLNFWVICLTALLITAVRSFIGYSIPISWRKEIWQGVFLFFMMGAGKALGGYVSDRFGAGKTGVITSLACIPFLIWGENMMVVSIIGIFIFSMTMSITFGMFLSVIKNNSGLAFGGTTLALFLGTLPVFLGINLSKTGNCILVTVLSVLCAVGFAKTTK